jgi:hypothetical protein
MSLATPTTQALSDSIVAQIEGSLDQTLPLLPKAFNRVLAKVLAGVIVILYKYVGFGWLQMFVQHASWRETEVNGRAFRPLVELGRMFGVGDPRDAVRAELTVQITVLSQVGTLPASQQLVNPRTGVIYLSLAPVPLDAATKPLPIRAYADPSGNGGGGVIGNLAPGDVIEFAKAVANVSQLATVSSLDVTGTEGETEAEYRARVLRRKQRPPQGGAYADYRLWAETVAGVANVYPYKGLPGQVNVYVECVSTLDADGIPDGTLLTAVGVAINLNSGGLATRRPVNDAVNPLAITRRAFTLVVTGLDVVNEAAAQASIATGVDEHLRTREPFIVGLSVLPRRDRITQGALAGIVHELVSAAGGSVSRVTLYRDGQLIDAYTVADGEKAKLAVGGITYE